MQPPAHCCPRYLRVHCTKLISYAYTCSFPLHTMKSYETAAPHTFKLGTIFRRVVSFMPKLLHSYGKRFLVPTEQERWVSARTCLDAWEELKISCPCWEWTTIFQSSSLEILQYQLHYPGNCFLCDCCLAEPNQHSEINTEKI